MFPEVSDILSWSHQPIPQEFLRFLQTEAMEHLQHLQMKVRACCILNEIKATQYSPNMQVYRQELTDEHKDKLATYFYDLPTTAKRRNVYIHPSPKVGGLRIWSLAELVERNGLKSGAGSFLYPGQLAEIPVLRSLKELTPVGRGI